MLITLALMLAAPQGRGVPLRLLDGGFCPGIGWISVSDPMGYSVERDAEVTIYRYTGSTGNWAIFDGAGLGSSSGRVLMRHRDVTIRRQVDDGKFSGYLVTDSSDIHYIYQGTIFTDTPADKAFFERIDFGRSGRAKCKRYWKS